MKFPLLQAKQTYYPKKALFPQCKKRKVFEPHSMAILAGGATYAERKRVKTGPHHPIEAFASITWHGAHDTGLGSNRDVYAWIDLAKDCQGGQFELYFCSTSCLRTFLNSWVDALEMKVQRELRKRRKRD